MSEPTVLTARRLKLPPGMALSLCLFGVLVPSGIVYFLTHMPRHQPLSVAIAPVAMLVLVAAVFPVVILLFRAEQRRRPPPRLEIAPERIALINPGGSGREWRKADGDLVWVTGRDRRPAIRIGRDAVSIPAVNARRFDMDELRAACVAQGWSWRRGGGEALPAVPAAAPDPVGDPAPEAPDTLLLREGAAFAPRRSPLLVVLPVVVSVSVAAAAVTVAGGNVGVGVMAMFPMIAVSAIVGHVYNRSRGKRLRIQVTVDRRRFAVEVGSRTIVAQRQAVDTVSFEPKRLVMGGGGRRVLWVLHHGRVEELRGALAAHGWPAGGTHPKPR